jgi:hypothetical protein
MKIAGLFAIVLLICLGELNTQNPVKIFTLHRDSIPAEHIYLHFDKQAYVAGESIWFKAYFLTQGIPVAAGTNFYADLLNEKGEIVQSVKLPVLANKIVSGQFDVPAGAQQGVYYIRAWTNYTCFLDHSYIFKKAIPVFNALNKPEETVVESSGYIFEWYPENGKIINNTTNVVAFRCTDKNHTPVSVSGTLLNSKGEDLGSFSTNNYGIGYFSFPAVKGMRYHAELQFADNTKQKIDLPPGADQGLVLNVTDHELGKMFSIIAPPEDIAAPKYVTLLAIMNNDVVLNAPVELKDNQAEGLVPVEKLPDGILKLYLFDKSNNLLAQRATFVTAGNNHSTAELQITRKGTGPKELNEWNLVLPPGTTGSFSVSVTDADKELLQKNDENIYSSLLFQPGRNRLANVKVKDEEIRDILMLTGAWMDDNWPAFSKMKPPRLNEEQHLPFKGKVYEQGKDKLITDGRLNILVKTKDSLSTEYTVPVMSDGSFKFYELAYEDTARIYYRWINPKNDKQAGSDLQIDPDTADYSSLLKNISWESWAAAKKPVLGNAVAADIASKIAENMKLSGLHKGRAKQVTVVTTDKKVNEGGTKEVNNRYATGAFHSLSSARVVDLVTEPPSYKTGNIFDYIVGKIGGVTIEKAGGRYTIYSLRSTSTREALSGNSRGAVAGKVFLDEQETSADQVARFPLEQIALVKYFAPGSIMLPGIGLSCVLSVYTRKPEDMNSNMKSFPNSLIFPGYPSLKQFYAPDYSVDDTRLKDLRNTLYWNPDSKPAEGTNVIPVRFYNSDHTKRFRLVLEGLGSDGKLISFEKLVE